MWISSISPGFDVYTVQNNTRLYAWRHHSYVSVRSFSFLFCQRLMSGCDPETPKGLGPPASLRSSFFFWNASLRAHTPAAYRGGVGFQNRVSFPEVEGSSPEQKCSPRAATLCSGICGVYPVAFNGVNTEQESRGMHQCLKTFKRSSRAQLNGPWWKCANRVRKVTYYINVLAAFSEDLNLIPINHL